LEEPLSFCFRRLACAAFLLAATARAAFGLNVHAVYRTACDREIGVILKVERRHVYLLRLDGTTVKIPRHEIASLAYYPQSQLPLAGTIDSGDVPALRVETMFGGQAVELATGWPIDYSDTKISILLASGKDLVIDRNSIWSLKFVPRSGAPAAPSQPHEAPVFVHPQTAEFCGQEDGQAGGRRVFAQQILNDNIVIKRELDRIEEGYAGVVTAAEDQKFYPVPQLYPNRTSLGLWASFGSRYGGSDNRPNNYTPMLIDERSFGPFRYQHVLLSGVAPSEMLLHAEPQSQVYYRFKVAYFHAAVLVDPNLVLTGDNYKWQPKDLSDETLDDRLVEFAGVEFGFDYGPFALELAPVMGADTAVKVGNVFDHTEGINLWRAGVRYTRRTWEAKLTLGANSFNRNKQSLPTDPTYGPTQWRYGYGRFNLTLQPSDRYRLLASVIVRGTHYGLDAYDNMGLATHHTDYDATSVATSLEGWVALGHRFRVGGEFVLETQSRSSTSVGALVRALPRGAVFTSFSF
jgi:hypothetical protein